MKTGAQRSSELKLKVTDLVGYGLDMNPGVSDFRAQFLISVQYTPDHVGWEEERGVIQVIHCNPPYLPLMNGS